MASLHTAHVLVSPDYHFARDDQEKQQAFAQVTVNGTVYRRTDKGRIFRHGEVVMVPMTAFWKLFAELEPDAVGISWTGKTGFWRDDVREHVISYSEDLSPLGALIVDAVFDAAYIDSPERAVRLKAQAAIRLLQLYGLYEPVEDWEPRILFDVLPQAEQMPAGYAWLADRPDNVVVDGFLQPGGCWLQLEQGYAYVLPITDANRTQQWMRIHIYGNPRGRMFTSSTVGPWSYPEFDAIDAFMAQHPMPAAQPATVINGPQISGSIQAGRSVNIATNMNVDNRDR